MDTTKNFPFLWIFAQNFHYFPPKKSNFGPIQIDIIAYIVSKVMNYDYANFHAFIKKLTPPPQCIKTPFIQIVAYICNNVL